MPLRRILSPWTVFNPRLHSVMQVLKPILRVNRDSHISNRINNKIESHYCRLESNMFILFPFAEMGLGRDIWWLLFVSGGFWGVVG